ncbi:hypothetical protein ASC97_07045 [Rhizobium sp. Root1203]|uniref:hypothetical protein n=1 Tax=Rhizobium sp. Root1203 TaxID=1736427 RepID=UPI00070C69B7|nr:hypothetical protein [Rhizobium sp. Root1203]KQV28098.1 hypothetical protein ASC97_07045 [Rhizobium sp. Root1203]
MNRFLASTLSTLNALYALAIMLFCVVYGGTAGQPTGSLSVSGAVLGVLVGLVASSMFCGFVAFLSLIEGHLRFLTEAAEYQNKLDKMRAERGQ